MIILRIWKILNKDFWSYCTFLQLYFLFSNFRLYFKFERYRGKINFNDQFFVKIHKNHYYIEHDMHSNTTNRSHEINWMTIMRVSRLAISSLPPTPASIRQWRIRNPWIPPTILPGVRVTRKKRKKRKKRHEWFRNRSFLARTFAYIENVHSRP